MLRARGHRVEVQNYIDNTGVQVADVVVGFHYLEHKTPADVRAMLADPAVRFDYYCWDLYAHTSAIIRTIRSRSRGGRRRCTRSKRAKAKWRNWRTWWPTRLCRRT
jgi:arginyl-tRNA synthetase